MPSPTPNREQKSNLNAGPKSPSSAKPCLPRLPPKRNRRGIVMEGPLHGLPFSSSLRGHRILHRPWRPTITARPSIQPSLLHLDIIAREYAVFCPNHARPATDASANQPTSREKKKKTHHQSLSLSVFFNTVMISPFLNPKSPGWSASKVNRATASFFLSMASLLA